MASFILIILAISLGMLLLPIMIIAYIIKGIYEFYFFRTDKFKKLKKSVEDIVKDYSELNDYVQDLGNADFSIFSSKDYGVATISDNSNYNYKRLAQMGDTSKPRTSQKFTYECSREVFKNAQRQPFKYICKYFDIEANEETLNNLENTLNKILTYKEGLESSKAKFEYIKNNLKNYLPFFVRRFCMEETMKELGFDKIDFPSVCYSYPEFIFKYESAGGNASQQCSVLMDIDNLTRFTNYISDIVDFKKTAKAQRLLMTPKLREQIKKRDNYTCKCCGVSIHEEPHLLLEIDHIVPVSKGGKTTEENLQTLCWKCNRTKSDKIN